jgi:DNA-binding transcriptional LysR family regulator
MELRHLRYFVAVAEELHFGRAAKRLGVSQPPLSAQIRDLEHELGAELFRRTHHKVELTDAGRALVERARDVLRRVGAMTDEAASVARGEHGLVTLGYTTTATYQLLSPLLARLRAQRIAVRLVELASPAQPRALADAAIDVGLACLPVEPQGCVAVPLVHEQITLAIPARSRLATRARVRLADVRDEPQVGLRDSAEPGWAQTCFAELVRGRVTGPVVAEADSKLALLGLVAAGLGVAVISSSLATLRREGVVYRPIADACAPLVLGALHRATSSALVLRVVDLAGEAAATISVTSTAAVGGAAMGGPRARRPRPRDAAPARGARSRRPRRARSDR